MSKTKDFIIFGDEEGNLYKIHRDDLTTTKICKVYFGKFLLKKII